MLKKQTGNMYEFVSHTWNVIRGKCEHSCDYCYMKKFKLGNIHLDEKEFKTDLGSDKFIFIGSGTDMWAKGVPSEWIKKVLEYTNKYPNNKYLFQSKAPYRFLEFLNKMPPKVILGTTIESNRNYNISKAPSCDERIQILKRLKKDGFETMITLEPILDFDLDKLVQMIKEAKPTWINIGADSKGHNLPEPSPEKIKKLIKIVEKETDVKLKNNLKRLVEIEK